MAEKSSWDQANRRQKLWRNRKKIGQIIKDYFYLPFFLLIILCTVPGAPRCWASDSFRPPTLPGVWPPPPRSGRTGLLLPPPLTGHDDHDDRHALIDADVDDDD